MIPQRSLHLLDQSHWLLLGADERAAQILLNLGEVMQLSARSGCEGSPILLYGDREPRLCGPSDCLISPMEHVTEVGVALIHLTRILSREMRRRGGVLLHAALAEWQGQGIVLAAPGGTGKTTASLRLKAPWRALCDDATLVVRDRRGRYWAHPWPTLSRFMFAGPGGSWPVEHGIPLKGVFFLRQARSNRLDPVGQSYSAAMLMESAEQASLLEWPEMSVESAQERRLECFGNCCALAKAVPACLLDLSLKGAFWRRIERVLEESCVYVH